MTVKLATVLVGLTFLIGCDTGPLADVPPPNFSVDCETQIIPDPDCESSGSGSIYRVLFDSLMSIDTEMSSSNYLAESRTSAPCPRWAVGSTTGITRNPRTGDDYEFQSSGRWDIMWVSALPYLLSSQAIYRWPRGPGDDSWSAFNLDKGGGRAKIWIDRARAVCTGAVVWLVCSSLCFTVYGSKTPTTGRGTRVPAAGPGEALTTASRSILLLK